MAGRGTENNAQHSATIAALIEQFKGVPSDLMPLPPSVQQALEQ